MHSYSTQVACIAAAAQCSNSKIACTAAAQSANIKLACIATAQCMDSEQKQNIEIALVAAEHPSATKTTHNAGV